MSCFWGHEWLYSGWLEALSTKDNSPVGSMPMKRVCINCNCTERRVTLSEDWVLVKGEGEATND